MPRSYTTDTAAARRSRSGGSLGGGCDNLMVFHTLSKRSSAPGLRSGFAAGSPEAIGLFNRLRSYNCAATPLATMAAATALWQDEAHVEATRALYQAKFAMAERLLAGRFGFYKPAGGFYLWLDVGDGERASKTLWQRGRSQGPAGRLILPMPGRMGSITARHISASRWSAISRPPKRRSPGWRGYCKLPESSCRLEFLA